MTNHGVLERPQTRAKIIAWLIEGKGPAEIAALVSTPKKPVSRQAISRFRQRHAGELAPVVERIEAEITEYAIAQLVNRIAGAQEDYDALGAIIDARANDTRYDEPGYATGHMVHSLKVVGAGKNQEIVDEYKVDTGVIAERRALRREVAEALDQLPRGKGDINIDNRTQVLIRQYGFDPEIV